MRRAWVATCAVTAVLVAGLAPAVAEVDDVTPQVTAADPVGFGTVTGTVRGPDGAPVPNVRVVAHVLRPGGWYALRDDIDAGAYWERASRTQADGTFRLALLPAPAAYRIEFRPDMQGVSSEYSGTYFGDGGSGRVQDGMDVHVLPDRTTPGTDATLLPDRGRIVGSVLEERDPDQGPRTVELIRDGYWLGRFTTDLEGRYSFPADPGVPYRVFMQPHDHATAKYWWHPGAADEADAEDIVVAPLGSADGSILPVTDERYFAVLSGTVTGPGGNPVPSAGLRVVREHLQRWIDEKTVEGRPDGTFEIAVPPGRFRLCASESTDLYASPADGSRYMHRCWRNSAWFFDADDLEVGQAERRADVDIRLSPPAAWVYINGYFGDSGLFAFRWDEVSQSWVRQTTTVAGPWKPFLPGRYRFRFGTHAWWPSGHTIEEASDVQLVAGSTFVIGPPPMPDCLSSISGSIVDLEGVPQGDERLSLVAVDEDGVALRWDDPGYTPHDDATVVGSTYVFHRVQPGRYRVLHDMQKRHVSYSTPPSRSWWPDSAGMAESAIIVVRPGESVADVDFTQSPGALVSGLVVDPEGTPTPNALVVLERYDELDDRWSVEQTLVTDHTGRFRSTYQRNDQIAVRSGDHRIRVETPWHARLGSSWWTVDGQEEPAALRTEPRDTVADVGIVVVGTGSAAPNDDPPPPGPVQASEAEPTRLPCQPTTPPPDATPVPTESGLPTSTPPSSPVPTPSTSPTSTPVLTPPEQRRGRLTVRSPRGNVVVVRNRESVKVRLVVGGRRSTLGPGARLRLRFGRSAVTWRARWTDPDLLPLRGRTWVR